ncbi:site-specific integrase [uncultured Duncaniella sp.]|nr:site-specific integrase [uncultured Duncaniella sp.]
MTSVKVKFRVSSADEAMGSIYYQVIHDRKVRNLTTDYKIYSSEWNEDRSTLVFCNRSERKALILSVRERIRWDVERLTKINRRLDASGLSYTADDLIEEFNRYAREYSLFNFMEGIIAKLKQNGKIRTSETYKSTLNSFKRFRDDDDIMLEGLTSQIMEEYEAWHRQRGVTDNTISFYTRILRATYNRAVEQEIIEDRNPFKRVYTGIEKTVKRALPLPVIKKIKALDLSHAPSVEFARDMFLMSFYLRGMSFIDMAFLKKSDLKYGSITYRRRKTGQRLVIAWTAEMQQLLDKYPENETEYLLPIIRRKGTVERFTCRNVGYNINRNLKKVAGKIGLEIPLTLYVARHSWASAAKAKGIPLSVISEGLGHDSETTTQIYLASLDTSVIDKANSLIMKSLK